MPLVTDGALFLGGAFTCIALLVGIPACKRGADKALLANGGMSLCLAVFAVTLHALLQTADPHELDRLIRRASLFLFTGNACLALFFGFVLHQKLKRRYACVAIGSLALAIFGFHSPGGVRHLRVEDVVERALPWGEVVFEHVGPIDPIGFFFLYTISFALFALPLVDALRSRGPLSIRVVVIASASASLVALGWDLLRDVGFHEGASAAVLAPVVVFAALAIWLTARERRLASRLADAYAQLSESNERCRAILDNTFQFIGLLDPNGRMLLANRAALQAVRATNEDVVGKHFSDTPWWASDELSRERLKISLKRAAAGSFERFRAMHKTADGQLLHIDFSVTPFCDEEGRVRYLIPEGRDVTELLRLEEQYRQVQKLDALGQLAGGVAHDFNNLLSGILGAGELLTGQVRGDPRSQRMVEIVMEAGQRAKELTAQLLAYSRRGRKTSEPINVHELIQATCALMEHTFDPRIRVFCQLDAKRVVVTGDRGQLQSALLNLCVNARDAMPDGGELHICTDEVGIDATSALSPAFELAEGDYVRLSVRDTGAGMSEAVQRHVFEPFFTTKPPGKGTGLGLASSYGTVVEHRGAISLASVEGRGTTFEILLPIAPTSEAVASASLARRAARAQRRVLVVDDRPMIREVAGAVLHEIGYEVDLMSRGSDAVAHFKGGGAPYDCVILDMAMPDMSGRDCFKALRGLVPDLRVVMCSGFVSDDMVTSLKRDGLAGFVTKPFSGAALAGAVEDAITSS